MDRPLAVKILHNVFGSYRVQGSELMFVCPACEHHKHKLSFNIDRNVFKCWICDYRGKSIRRAVRRFGSFSDLIEWDRISGKPDITQFDFLFTEIEEEKVTVELPKEFKTLATRKPSIVDKEPINYLLARGLTKEDIIRWKIGYCNSGPYKNRIIIPSFDDEGDLNYFISRTYRGDFYKYKNPRANKNVVFNELFVDWDKDLTIVEGVFDAIVAGNSVPILGSTLSNDSRLIQKIVLNDTPVFIALDEDARDKENKLIRTLLKYDIELYKIDTSGIEDIGSISKQEFERRKKTAVRVDNTDYLLLDLLAAI